MTENEKKRELNEQELEDVSGGKKLSNSAIDHGCNSKDFKSTLDFYNGGAICMFCKHYNRTEKACRKGRNNTVFNAPPFAESHTL